MGPVFVAFVWMIVIGMAFVPVFLAALITFSTAGALGHFAKYPPWRRY